MIVVSVFFFNDTATTEIYTLSLHDALPISLPSWRWRRARPTDGPGTAVRRAGRRQAATASQRGQRHEGRRGACLHCRPDDIAGDAPEPAHRAPQQRGGHGERGEHHEAHRPT